MQAKRGDVVTSIAGHDAGRRYYVIKTEGDFLYLADGKHKKLSTLKKKRARHVLAEGLWTHSVTERLARGEAVPDKEIRNALAAFRDTFSRTKEV